MPLITHLWTQTFDALSSGLEANDTTPCSYDRRGYRFCVQLKTELRASGSPRVLRPSLRFQLRATCGVATSRTEAAATVIVSEFDADKDAIGKVRKTAFFAPFYTTTNMVIYQGSLLCSRDKHSSVLILF